MGFAEFGSGRRLTGEPQHGYTRHWDLNPLPDIRCSRNAMETISKHRKLAELIYKAFAERAQISEKLTDKVSAYLASINEAFRYASEKMQMVDPQNLESILTWLEKEIQRLEADGYQPDATTGLINVYAPGKRPVFVEADRKRLQELGFRCTGTKDKCKQAWKWWQKRANFNFSVDRVRLTDEQKHAICPSIFGDF